ncbi:MAG: hypothetical protein ABI273_19335 [Lacunisphaera sp.]
MARHLKKHQFGPRTAAEPKRKPIGQDVRLSRRYERPAFIGQLGFDQNFDRSLRENPADFKSGIVIRGGRNRRADIGPRQADDARQRNFRHPEPDAEDRPMLWRKTPAAQNQAARQGGAEIRLIEVMNNFALTVGHDEQGTGAFHPAQPRLRRSRVFSADDLNSHIESSGNLKNKKRRRMFFRFF